MPTAPKRLGHKATPPRPAWHRTGPDLRKGFRGANRQAAKRRVLFRDDCQCCQCGRVVDMHDSILDHKVPISQGGGHDDENLQTLCKRCSGRKTQRESREGRR